MHYGLNTTPRKHSLDTYQAPAWRHIRNWLFANSIASQRQNNPPPRFTFVQSSPVSAGTALGWINGAQVTHSVLTQTWTETPERPYGLRMAPWISAGNVPVCQHGWLSRSPVVLWRGAPSGATPPPSPPVRMREEKKNLTEQVDLKISSHPK